MSKTKRKRYTAEFKAQIALEAIKGEQTVAELARSLSHARRKNMVEPDQPEGLSIARQCQLLSINRSSYYYQPNGEPALNIELMRLMGLAAIYQKPNTSKPQPQHKVYPYLLRNLNIDRPNQIWCADITYIPMRRGFFYQVAIMDWHSRKVLSWRLSSTMDADFCVAALEEA